MRDFFDSIKDLLSGVVLFMLWAWIIWEIGNGLAVLYLRGELLSWLWHAGVFVIAWAPIIGKWTIIFLGLFAVTIGVTLAGGEIWDFFFEGKYRKLFTRADNWLGEKMQGSEPFTKKPEQPKQKTQEEWEKLWDEYMDPIREAAFGGKPKKEQQHQKTEAKHEPLRKEHPKPPPKEESIRSLWIRALKKYHPDGTDDPREKEFRHRLTVEINGAYKRQDKEWLWKLLQEGRS